VKRCVVLVHGLWYGPVSLALLGRRLRKAGHEVHCFGYPTLRQSLPANARALRDFIRSLDVDRCDLVGHSLGGLVILRMLDEYGDIPPGRVVLLGSPVRGSAVARRVAGKRVLRPLVGQARAALAAGFDRAPPGRETGVIAGERSVGVGRLFGGLSGPDDGTVAVDECRLPGADLITLPVTHTGLVAARSVADAVSVFLQSGRFGHDHSQGLQS